MKAYIFTPGDSICRKGEVAREMFIIADGILEVLSETGKVLTTMVGIWIVKYWTKDLSTGEHMIACTFWRINEVD